MPVPWGPIGRAIGTVGGLIGVADHGAKIGAKRKVRQNLAELFREHFLADNGTLREDRLEAECAGLKFVRSCELTKDWSGAEYYLVRIVNESKMGDDPDRVRKMGYFPKSGKIGFPPSWAESY